MWREKKGFVKNLRLLIDANIVLDILQKREPYFEASAQVSKMCETQMAEGHLSVLSFANLAYIMRKELDAEKVEQVLTTLSLIFHFDDLTHKDLSYAVGLKWDDFEDALQASVAKRIKADYIITRNIKDFKDSRIKAITPADYLAMQR